MPICVIMPAIGADNRSIPILEVISHKSVSLCVAFRSFVSVHLSVLTVATYWRGSGFSLAQQPLVMGAAVLFTELNL